jgi:hypothetical protein
MFHSNQSLTKSVDYNLTYGLTSLEEQLGMKKNQRSALLFSLAGLCSLFVGIISHDGRPLSYYGNIVAGILFLVVAVREYKKKDIQ